VTIDTTALRALREAGTAGEWHDCFCHWGKSGIVASDENGDSTISSIGRCTRVADDRLDPEDAALIVAAVNAIVPLCDEVERLRAVNAETKVMDEAMVQAMDAANARASARAQLAEARAIKAETSLMMLGHHPDAGDEPWKELAEQHAIAVIRANAAEAEAAWLRDLVVALGECAKAFVPALEMTRDSRVRNYVTSTLTLGEKQIDLTLQVVGGKTPCDVLNEKDARIAELEHEAEDMRNVMANLRAILANKDEDIARLRGLLAASDADEIRGIADKRERR